QKVKGSPTKECHSNEMSPEIRNRIPVNQQQAYEVVVNPREERRRMVGEQEDVFFYITLMNENYPHPPMPEGAEEDILKGMYLLTEAEGSGPRVQLLGSGTILREVEAAAELLREDFGVAADIWSVPSFTELAREGMAVERWNTVHPAETPRT